MSDLNPYQSPATPFGPREGQPDIDTLLYEATQSLTQTKPWVRFLSVLGFVASAGVILAVVAISLAAGGAGAPGPFELIIVIPMFVLFYFIPSLLLWNYASRIAEFQRSRTTLTFSAAIAAQKSFWKYLGILVLVIMCLYAVALLGFLVLPVVLSMMR